MSKWCQPKIGLGTVLVISANEIRRPAIVRHLIRAGYDVHDYSSLAEIRLKIAYAAPDLIITDMSLPGGTTGVHLRDNVIRKDPDFQEIPVIIIHEELKRRRPRVRIDSCEELLRELSSATV